MKQWAVASVCAVAVSLSTTSLLAQPSDEAPAGYDDAVALGLKELELQNFSEARARFLEAHTLYPNARTLRALGKVEYELRHYVESVNYLEQALSGTVRPLTAEMQADVQEVLSKARGYVARYKIAVTPKDAELFLDGKKVELPSDGVLMLNVGDHTLLARAEKHQPMQSRISVAGGEEMELSFALIPEAATDLSPAAAAATTTPTTADDNAATTSHAQTDNESSVFGKWWLWTGAGVILAGAVVTGVLLAQQDPSVEPVPGGTAGTIYLSPVR